MSSNKAYNYGNGEELRPVTLNCSPTTLKTLERYQYQQGEMIGKRVSRSLGLAMLVKEAERKGVIQ